MKLYVFALVFGFGVACGGAPATESGSPAVSPELAALEARATIDGAELPPRADSPRTVVVFFASW